MFARDGVRKGEFEGVQEEAPGSRAACPARRNGHRRPRDARWPPCGRGSDVSSRSAGRARAAWSASPRPVARARCKRCGRAFPRPSPPSSSASGSNDRSVPRPHPAHRPPRPPRGPGSAAPSSSSPTVRRASGRPPRSGPRRAGLRCPCRGGALSQAGRADTPPSRPARPGPESGRGGPRPGSPRRGRPRGAPPVPPACPPPPPLRRRRRPRSGRRAPEPLPRLRAAAARP